MYRVTGLLPAEGYAFQVRPWTNAGAGTASGVMGGRTALVGADGIPQTVPDPLLERGRQFRIGKTDYTFVVPPRMLLRMRPTAKADGFDVPVTSAFSDATTGAYALIDLGSGEIVQEVFWEARTKSYRIMDTRTGQVIPDVAWEDSLPPPSGHNLRALWDEIAESIRREPLPWAQGRGWLRPRLTDADRDDVRVLELLVLHRLRVDRGRLGDARTVAAAVVLVSALPPRGWRRSTP